MPNHAAVEDEALIELRWVHDTSTKLQLAHVLVLAPVWQSTQCAVADREALEKGPLMEGSGVKVPQLGPGWRRFGDEALQKLHICKGFSP